MPAEGRDCNLRDLLAPCAVATERREVVGVVVPTDTWFPEIRLGLNGYLDEPWLGKVLLGNEVCDRAPVAAGSIVTLLRLNISASSRSALVMCDVRPGVAVSPSTGGSYVASCSVTKLYVSAMA